MLFTNAMLLQHIRATELAAASRTLVRRRTVERMLLANRAAVLHQILIRRELAVADSTDRRLRGTSDGSTDVSTCTCKRKRHTSELKRN